MSAKVPPGWITDPDIGGSSANPVKAYKLQHVYKKVCNFGLPAVASGHTRKLNFGVGAKVGATAGFVVNAADNLPYVATLPASQTGSTLVIPIDDLPIGWMITGYKVVAQVESGGNTVTIDGDLRATTNAAADPTDASIGTMTQVSVTADTAVAQEKTGLSEVVTSGKSYYLKLTATTGAATDIIVQHGEIYLAEIPTDKREVVFVADIAGTLIDVAAGLWEAGTNTNINFDLQKGVSTSLLSAAINVIHGTGDRTEVDGSIAGTGAIAVGDVLTAVMTVTSAVNASGPWIRFTIRQDGE